MSIHQRKNTAVVHTHKYTPALISMPLNEELNEAKCHDVAECVTNTKLMELSLYLAVSSKG